MTGSIVQVNISRGGVPKWPVSECMLTPLGLEGDQHGRPEIHGGPRQALLLIAAETVEALRAQGYPVFFGALGENFTTRGIDRRQLREGQRYRVGEAVIELTKVRGPCATLNAYGPGIQQEIYDQLVKAGDVSSPRWAMSGFYAVVVRTGLVRKNDIIALIDQVV